MIHADLEGNMSDSIHLELGASRRPQPMVNRCVCHDVAFATILEWSAKRPNTTVQDIRDEFGCTQSCGMYGQYLRTMLKTREANIPLVLQGDCEASPKERSGRFREWPH